MHIERYIPARAQTWDEFVVASKNGTFLFLRSYLDYHKDRFADHSFLVWDDEQLIALLPANRTGNILTSHGGLTYGGFLMSAQTRLPQMMEAFSLLIGHLAAAGITRLLYKTIPHIYHTAPAEEDRYCLFRNGGKLYRSDVLTVINYQHRYPYQDRRTRGIKRARKLGLRVEQTDDYAAFWEILTENLTTRHGLMPVHTREEICLLASRFPDQIRCYACFENMAMVAGAVLYLSANVCHVQYNAASPRGKQLSAQDVLLDELVQRYGTLYRYFDFGVSTERDGQYLNAGLTHYKEGFGGRTVVHDFFVVDI
jgi:hypothetical protein